MVERPLRLISVFIALCIAVGCEQRQASEDYDDWFDGGDDLDVLEPITWTDENYSIPAGDNTIASLKSTAMPSSSFNVAFAQADSYDSGSCQAETNSQLPFEIEGVVTMYPRYYFKSDGCDRDSDEKYYGSYYIQDRTGGIFVLGDSKVSHFDVGDRVKLRVRGTRDAFDLPMVYAHDVLEIERNYSGIYRQPKTTSFTTDDIGFVWTVEGEVTHEPDTFGEFRIRTDDGVNFSGTIDSDLNRRGFTVNEGERVRFTGPLHYAYSVYSLLLMQTGQIEVVDE